MLAFEGERLPRRIAARLAEAPAAGVTLFRHYNIGTPTQVRELTADIQRAGAAAPEASPARPLLIAADQVGIEGRCATGAHRGERIRGVLKLAQSGVDVLQPIGGMSAIAP